MSDQDLSLNHQLYVSSTDNVLDFADDQTNLAAQQELIYDNYTLLNAAENDGLSADDADDNQEVDLSDRKDKTKHKPRVVTAIGNSNDEEVEECDEEYAEDENEQSRKPKALHIIDAHVITQSNFNGTRWANTSYRSITVDRCGYEFTTNHLVNSLYSLTSVNFSRFTLLSNVICFLRNCLNLRTITFSDLTLDKKGRQGKKNRQKERTSIENSCTNLNESEEAESQVDSQIRHENTKNVEKLEKWKEIEFEPIQVQGVKELDIHNWTRKLSKYDYWLVRFLTKYVTFSQLESFTFQGPSGLCVNEVGGAGTTLQNSSGKSLSKNGTKANYSVNSNSHCKTSSTNYMLPVIPQFLQKNCATLKNLSIGGVGFKMYENDDVLVNDIEEELKPLQLQTIVFGLDTHGVDPILKSQTALKTLSCSGSTAGPFTPLINSRIMSCISNNFATLTSIGIYPCLIRNHVLPCQYNNLYTLNCEIFRKCVVLENLYVNITVGTKHVKGDKLKQTQGRSCGAIINMNHLPTTLVHVELYCEEFNSRQLDILGKKLHEFQNLERLVLSSSSAHRFIVQLDWIKTLTTLPKMKTVDFFGGRMADIELTRSFLQSTQNLQNITITHFPNSVSFHTLNSNVAPNIEE